MIVDVVVVVMIDCSCNDLNEVDIDIVGHIGVFLLHCYCDNCHSGYHCDCNVARVRVDDDDDDDDGNGHRHCYVECVHGLVHRLDDFGHCVGILMDFFDDTFVMNWNPF